MKSPLKVLVFSFFICANLSWSQSSDSFYEHYTGLISEELKLTADLIKSHNDFTGFYYYEFKEDGVWITSKPIALDGRVDEQNNFVLNEFGDYSSFFQGHLDNSKLITGEWINKNLGEPVQFTLKATYAQGSIPLNLSVYQSSKLFDDQIGNPNAEFNISLLFPNAQLDEAVYHQLLDRIYYYIGYRGKSQNQKDILSQLEDRYYQQFQSSLANIKLDSFPETFNWSKNIRMDVINNESGLLCLQFETYAKTGDRDGTLVRKYLVFSLKENKVLKIEDVFKEESISQLESLLEKKLRQNYRIDDEAPLSSVGFFQDSIPVTKNFYLHPGGIGFYYNVFEIAPQSTGSSDVFIPFSEIQAFLKPEVQSFFR
ncbi:RsiV family protein [Lentimicrobium sp. S6]|uniref:RsiV family protein n=1 Tax=Lentimicrobium sp. S6 TaxID=2735872 RepID=UPI001551EEB8|nr:RsiV family protein [Lentimicrobium sp. S6]NPD46244.1 DUF3298 domain-containing protein [Lentimicrobium sp. S6]